jgi:hypothetical protein
MRKKGGKEIRMIGREMKKGKENEKKKSRIRRKEITQERIKQCAIRRENRYREGSKNGIERVNKILVSE